MANNNFKNMSYEEFVNKVWDDFYSFLDMIKEDPRPNLDKIIPLLSKEEQSIAIDYLVAHDNFIDDVNECVEIIRRIISKLIASLEPSENSLTYSRGIINLFYQTMQLGVLATIEREKIDNFNNFLASAVKRAKERAEFQREKDKLNKLDNLDIIRQDVKEGFITTAAKLHRVQETIEDQHRHSGELWATIPHCVRAVLDAVEIEKNEGRDMPRPSQFNALRIAVQRRLASKGKRARKSTKGTFYPVADIAEVLAEEYRGFTTVQYIREFEPFGLQEKDLPPVHKA